MLIFQIKRIISSEKWFNYVVTSFFFENAKIWVGWTTLNGEKKEDGLTVGLYQKGTRELPTFSILVQYSDKLMHGFVKFLFVLLRFLLLCFCTILI